MADKHLISSTDNVLNPIICNDTIKQVLCSVGMSEMYCSHSISCISVRFCQIAMKIGSLESWQLVHFQSPIPILIVWWVQLFVMIWSEEFCVLLYLYLGHFLNHMIVPWKADDHHILDYLLIFCLMFFIFCSTTDNSFLSFPTCSFFAENGKFC